MWGCHTADADVPAKDIGSEVLLQEEAPQEGVQEAAAAQHASELQAFRRQVQIRDEQIRQQEDELMALRERLVLRPQYLYRFHLLVRL